MSNNGLDLDLYEFGPFRLDPAQRLLLRHDQHIPLQPKAFETLLVLVRNSERVVLKDELLDTVWANTFVEESNLTQNISVLRKALRDGDSGRRYIITVPGRGYRFAESVRTLPPRQPIFSQAPSPLPFKNGGVGLPDIKPVSRVLGGLRVQVTLALIAVLALSAAGYVLWRQYRPPRPANPARIMLAVLPFQNLTGDPEQEYFADGLTEELTAQLGRLRGEQLGVIARTSVMAYKHSNKGLDQIARELSVQYVIEGSLRRTADRVRITAQLIQTKDQSHLWVEDYDRTLQDVLTVQDDVAASVAQEIQIRLTPQQVTELTHPRAVDTQAYEDYLKGRYFWNKRTEDGFRKAIEHFEAAIARDPNFAQAYAGLADTYVLMGGYAFAPQRDVMPKARTAALKALAVDDHLAEAYTSLGLILIQYDWNWAEAGKSYRRAIELNPNYSVAHHWYGDGYLSLIGKSDEAIAELRKAHELDPLSLIIDVDLAKRLCFAGKQDESLREFGKILDADPNYTQAHFYLSQCYAMERSYAQAIAEVQKIQPLDANSVTTAWLGCLYALTNRRKEALRVVDELRQKSPRTNTDSGIIAQIYIALGETDLAFVWLEKAYNERSPNLLGLKSWSFYDPLRSDPRFADLIRRVGLP